MLVPYKTTASSTLALLQGSGHLVHHIRSKSTSENDTGGWRYRWDQTRSRTPSAYSDGTSAGIVEFRITRSLGARLNTASDTPLALHHSRRRLWAESISLLKLPRLFFSCFVGQLIYGILCMLSAGRVNWTQQQFWRTRRWSRWLSPRASRLSRCEHWHVADMQLAVGRSNSLRICVMMAEFRNSCRNSHCSGCKTFQNRQVDRIYSKESTSWDS